MIIVVVFPLPVAGEQPRNLHRSTHVRAAPEAAGEVCCRELPELFDKSVGPIL
jgi:hypothetical protein